MKSRIHCKSCMTAIVLGLLTAGIANAQEGRPPASGWKTTVTAAYAWQGDTDIDSGGDFSVDRGVLEIRTSSRTGRRTFTGFTVGYQTDNYQFNQLPVQPWSDIRTLQFGLSLRHLASDKWMLFGLPLLRYSAEDGKDLSDGREYGLLAGASYRASDRLTIGPGLGVISGIGGEEDVFPILLIDWKITDTVSLETGRGIAASRGPGLTLKWQPQQSWEFGLAARYEKSRFRLANNDNIGEDRAVPVILTAKWSHNRKFALTGFAGFETSGKLTLEDRNGSELQSLEYDTAPVAGIAAEIKF